MTTKTAKTPKSAGAIRLRIRFLQKTWGPMSAWPVAARLEYLRLAAALRQMERQT